MVAALIVGSKGISDITREYLDKFWKVLDEMLNAVLFVLNISRTMLLVGLVAIVLTLVARWVSVGGPRMLLKRCYPFDRQTLRVLT